MSARACTCACVVLRAGMSIVTNVSNDAAINGTTAPPAPPLPCGIFGVRDCEAGAIDDEDRFLALVILSLACVVFVLCVLVCMLTVLVHKLSTIWVKALVRPAAQTEPSDDPRKGLLQETKSSLRDTSASAKAEGKKKKTSFAEDTSCAAPRDVDEEDL